MTEESTPYDGDEAKAKTMTISLYERDIRDVETVRQYHKLDKFTHAVRRAIRDAAEAIEKDKAVAA